MYFFSLSEKKTVKEKNRHREYIILIQGLNLYNNKVHSPVTFYCSVLSRGINLALDTIVPLKHPNRPKLKIGASLAT